MKNNFPLRRLGRLLLFGFGAALLGLGAALAAPEPPPPNPLQTILAQRFTGDRSGACLLAALIEGPRVQQARVCAQARAGGHEPGYDSLFEIGSISKTMTAFLVAELIQQGRWSLDDPIAKHLPQGTPMPRQGERQILVRDLLTHRSGLPALPPGFAPKNPFDPYADLSEAQLLAALGQVRLERPIGSQFEYSNFAMMLVSAAVARSSSGGDFEQAMVRLFEPLQMRSAFIATPREPKAPLAQGHLPTGQVTPAWTITPNLAGVGMVRASLDDMTRYAQAQLGLLPQLAPELQAALTMTQQALNEHSGMSWMRVSHQGRTLLTHEGGTGGFSSLLMLEPAAGRALVLLADTALTDLGGLGDVGSALLGLSEQQALRPRLKLAAPPDLLAALPGPYEISGMKARLWLDGAQLMAQVEGQAAFALDYDSWGDFYPRHISALLRPVFQNGKVEHALWQQGGGVLELRRLGSLSATKASDPRWQELVGEYQLMPQFSLRVFEDAGQLKVQATGQPAIAAELSGPDRIEIKAVGAIVEFKRDGQGQLRSAVLLQGGQKIEGLRK
ncbi:beta-lactamase family protein [Paucibacter sp. TC2R-5]|uniref:serine hydrolase domain-containing protein n=1 Tax=Paucibacter sp. TC2R-5 TaxID=2893555 RepID=UPI0021E3A318|nr:serine hydrolase domain-containing protein [Paucibacter sp. TC2R-5]MCV2359923.1 beta-lactamase family protein [Paucibacter sp. TC2R-5]